MCDKTAHGRLSWLGSFLPIGTAYAVWAGIGASLAVIDAMVTGAKTASLVKVLFLLMIVGGVVGLKLSH